MKTTTTKKNEFRKNTQKIRPVGSLLQWSRAEYKSQGQANGRSKHQKEWEVHTRHDKCRKEGWNSFPCGFEEGFGRICFMFWKHCYGFRVVNRLKAVQQRQQPLQESGQNEEDGKGHLFSLDGRTQMWVVTTEIWEVHSDLEKSPSVVIEKAVTEKSRLRAWVKH